MLSQDEVALRRDLDSLAFRLGERRGHWARVRLTFPHLYVRVAAPARGQGPKAFLVRLDCRGYRATAPTGALWDGRTDTILALPLRPKRLDQQIVMAFTAGCGDCFYHPIDRQARPHWAHNHSDLAWGPTSTIVTFMECLHDLLQDRDYHSSAAPDAAAFLPTERLDQPPERAA